jgi:hypothetical protein
MKALFKKNRKIKAQTVRITDDTILNLEKTESQRNKWTNIHGLSLSPRSQKTRDIISVKRLIRDYHIGVIYPPMLE